jgi:glycogen synthase
MAGCYEEIDSEVPTFHIDLDDRFSAGDNPYAYENEEQLLIDALAFCAAVPAVLERLGYTKHLLFHAHDWETAPIALFARYSVISSMLEQAKAVITLHNMFDAPFSSRYKRLFFGKDIPGATVLQSMLPLFSGPLLTVSIPYAHELRYHPLQCGVFADHLQEHFSRNPPIGIEHGMFGKPDIPFTNRDISAAEAGDVSLLLKKKRIRRKAACSAITGFSDRRCRGTFRKSLLENPSIPLLFMSGRLDLMQKGFDTVFHAFSRLPYGQALLFFTPTLHSDTEDLSFFTDMEKRCRGTIVLWPLHIPSGRYRAILRGASFLLMPSLYEPYGAASEGSLNGTPLMARATGGLLAQIQPGDDFAVPEMYRTFFPSKASQYCNGILYHETNSGLNTEANWRRLLELSPARRTGNPLYNSIVDAAEGALKKTIKCFNNREAYGRMIFNSLRWVENSTWDQATGKYRAVYEITASRGF